MRLPHALALTALLAAPAAAAEPNDYDICLALVETDPARAESEAAHWVNFGGGPPARHCRALALLALGADLKAATELAAIGVEAAELPPDARADILNHAAEVFLAAGEPEAGLQAVDRSMVLRADAEAWTLRASLLAGAGRWGEAVAALDRALAAAPPTAERATLRAAAKRRAGRPQEARADALWALELAPGDPTALLELGALEAALGNRPAARDAFLAAIEADPESPAARFARRRLQELETGG